jgi:hypothetical protein
MAASQIRSCLVAELSKHKYLYVLTEKAEYVDCDALFGSKVTTAFPSAAFDIKHAGNCFAAECPTAAVFHLMRAVEWGLRALAAHLGFRRDLRTRTKSGKVVYTPLAWAEWEKILEALRNRVDERIVKLKRGPRKQVYQEFYHPAIKDIAGFKEAWRNHVMHTRREYSPEDAGSVFVHVKSFMIILATRISE